MLIAKITILLFHSLEEKKIGHVKVLKLFPNNFQPILKKETISKKREREVDNKTLNIGTFFFSLL